MQFVQNGDLLFAGPMPFNFQSAMQCSQMVVGGLLSTALSTSTGGSYQSSATTSDVTPVNPAARGFLQGSVDALRLSFVNGFVTNQQTSVISELIGNYMALYDPPPIPNAAQQAITSLPADQCALLHPYHCGGVRGQQRDDADLHSAHRPSVCSLHLPCNGATVYLLTKRAAPASSSPLKRASLQVAVSTSPPFPSSLRAQVTSPLYQVVDDGSEFGQPLWSQPLAAMQTITHPRLIVWVQPGVSNTFDSSTGVPSTLIFTFAAHSSAYGQQPSNLVSQATISFALPPALLFAQFSPSGSSISVYFDSPLPMASPSLQRPHPRRLALPSSAPSL